MPTLVVDPVQFAHAATGMTEVARSTQSAASSLAAALSGSGGMGGSDNAGVEWSTSYDEGARAAMSAVASAVGAAGNVATRLHATGANHAHADAAATIGGSGDAALPAPPSPPTMAAPAPPSAAGGSGGGPPGWSLVEGLVGYVWPNGHQDRLHAADAAWQATAAQLQAAASPVAGAASAVSAQQSPECGAAATACTDTGQHLSDLVSVCTELGGSCSEYAAHLDQAHQEIISTLKELIIETAAIEAGGAVLAFFTAGLDEIAAQALVAARIATAAAKIRRVIEALIDAARAVAAAVEGFAGRAAEVLSKLEPLATGAVKTAASAAAKAGRAGASAARSSTPALGKYGKAVKDGAIKNAVSGAAMEAGKEGVVSIGTGENHMDASKIVAQGAFSAVISPIGKAAAEARGGADTSKSLPQTLAKYGTAKVTNAAINSTQQEIHSLLSPDTADDVKGTSMLDVAREAPDAVRNAPSFAAEVQEKMAEADSPAMSDNYIQGPPPTPSDRTSQSGGGQP
ncbi:hypothetical protein [Williamsia herbipolensis]|uniref:WXG100-like domain-containing protein n=1 Tax=Williamsia herbipolensis TaxID=1603258 RepID=UPI000AB32087|nr:hypothetical protein [Williamsia herbipolensis]